MWAIIDNSTNERVGDYYADDARPTAGDEQRVVERPDGMNWDPTIPGFVLPPIPELITVGRFKLLLTQAERIEIRAAAASSAQVADFLDLLNGFTDGVSLDDPNLITAIGQMQAAGLLTEARAAEVLAGTAP